MVYAVYFSSWTDNRVILRRNPEECNMMEWRRRCGNIENGYGTYINKQQYEQMRALEKKNELTEDVARSIITSYDNPYFISERDFQEIMRMI